MNDLICKHCSKNFKYNFEEWELHLKMEHGRIPVLVCKECQLKCVGIDDFDRHQEFDHGRKLASLCLALKQAKRQYGEMF
jgi:hypothetical protein